MVKLKTLLLTSFSNQRNALLTLLARKIAASKVTTVNSDIDNRYRTDTLHVAELLSAIEAKFKRCEILYYLYLEDADHGVLSGNISTLPTGVECTFYDGTVTIGHTFVVDDRHAYKNIIDLNFQTFILTTSSLYENLVLLSEIFLKKVIVYVRKPLSSPLHDYLESLRLLIKLGYRENDKLNICMSLSDPYFKKYLKQINELRNKFIHGFSINLESDGYNYYVVPFDKDKFTAKSAELQIDVFSKTMLDETRQFIVALMTALKDSGIHHTKTIPA